MYANLASPTFESIILIQAVAFQTINQNEKSKFCFSKKARKPYLVFPSKISRASSTSIISSVTSSAFIRLESDYLIRDHHGLHYDLKMHLIISINHLPPPQAWRLHWRDHGIPYAVRRISYTSSNWQKYRRGTSVTRVEIWALRVNYPIFQNWQVESKIVISFCSAANSWTGHLMVWAGFLS